MASFLMQPDIFANAGDCALCGRLAPFAPSNGNSGARWLMPPQTQDDLSKRMITKLEWKSSLKLLRVGKWRAGFLAACLLSIQFPKVSLAFGSKLLLGTELVYLVDSGQQTLVSPGGVAAVAASTLVSVRELLGKFETLAEE